MNARFSTILGAVTFASVWTAAEAVVVLGLISHYIPFKPDPLAASIFWHYRSGILPERELALYLGGIVIAVALFAAACSLMSKHELGVPQQWRQYSAYELILVLSEIHAVFAIVVFPSAQWPWHVFYGLLLLSALTKIFWPEVAAWVAARRWPNFQWPQLGPSNQAVWTVSKHQRLWDLAAVLFVAAVIYIPDPQSVVAQLFMGDYFHSWDVVFMGTVYGFFQHLVPGVDVNFTYGLGMPALLAMGMKLLGGFNYTYALQVLFTLGIVYYALWYLLLRRLLQRPLLAFAAVVLGMRAQMFLAIVVPIVWNEAQASIFRYCFDIGLFWCLWLYEQRQQTRYLWGMSAFAGLGLFHMPTTGIFMAAVCAGHAILSLVKSGHQGRLRPATVLIFIRPLVFIPVVLLILTYATVGQYAFTGRFWQRTLEWSSFFAHGFFYGPMLGGLKSGEYVKVLVGLLFPVFYLLSAFYTGYRFCFDQGNARQIFVCLLAFYGLGLFTYYVGMSHKYYSVGLPAIFILFYWIDTAISGFGPAQARYLSWAVVALCMYCLLSTHMFRAYPNVLNISRNPIVDPRVAMKVGHNSYYFHQLSIDFPEWIKLPVNSLGQHDEQFKFEKDFVNDAALKSYYRQETAFTEDAALIDHLTTPDERVALLSSFEVMILSKAHRKPFFYYFPLLNSHPMRARNFVVTTIFSYPQLEQCIRQMETQKPPYVFMEKIFLTERVPLWYGEQFEDLIALIRYVRANYEPVQGGEYLVAMKRKNNDR